MAPKLHSRIINISSSVRLRSLFIILLLLGLSLFVVDFFLLNILTSSSSAAKAGGDEYMDLSSEVYHLPAAFKISYAEMERKLRVFVYPGGDTTPRALKGKYASEDYFFKNIRESRFLTLDPREAHLFFIPISCHKRRGSGSSSEDITNEIGDYVRSLVFRYPYWNRTLGADHFFVTCHDIGARATEAVPSLVKNSIRVLCSSSYSNGYIPHKDIALPQVKLPFSYPARGNDLKNRTTLGFWAGRLNSDVRVALANMWNSDPDLDIQNSSRALKRQYPFFRAKFCICPRKSDVNDAFLADSIHYGCVPVIMSDYHDLPFNDILDWQKFSVILKERDVPRLKYILRSISDADFVALHKNLVKVRRHFRWSTPPKRYDAFHMVMHELWLRRHVIRY